MKAALSHLRRVDPVLAEIIARVGPYAIARREPTFETLARSITFQQLSGKAAGTIFERLRNAVGPRFTAAGFLKLGEGELRECGLSRQKIASLTDLARRVANRQVNFRNFHKMTNDEIIAELLQVRGIGLWTAQMFLMFALERLDVMPIGDLGIRNAIRKAYSLDEIPKPSEIAKLSEKWRPYCTVASWYLWRSLEGQAEI